MRGTRPYRHICLPPLARAGLACSHCMRSQPRCGTPQQAHACSRSFRHWTSLCTVIDCPNTQRIPPPRRARAIRLACGSLSDYDRETQARRMRVSQRMNHTRRNNAKTFNETGKNRCGKKWIRPIKYAHQLTQTEAEEARMSNPIMLCTMRCS